MKSNIFCFFFKGRFILGIIRCLLNEEKLLCITVVFFSVEWLFSYHVLEIKLCESI